MDITEFVELSLGRWRSQRSVHHLAFRHFEQVTSTIDIEPIDSSDKAIIELCKIHQIEPKLASSAFRMTWEGESDWDEDEVTQGSTILVPIPNRSDRTKGILLREQGYAETIPAVGNYTISADGTFILHTKYQRATAEEKIWFAMPNLRFRVSSIKTSEGTGVVTASFSSEIRSLASNN
ncbi:phycobiliprotein lyase [Myxosarcina sp. GI1]|uniref:phycobiliprotein lyase n=1 Tax=Myxosarcina sp. GI1 TaxID=1541065 RepID=UPI00056CFD57|nr:phycobiliprotein lyase [Myxosarcina sp. GI1]